MTQQATGSAATGWWPTKLFGYTVEQKLGEGAASTIWAVCDPSNRQMYVLKHVIRKTDKDQRFIEQMQNEFEVSKAFTHPALRKCVDLKVKKTLFFKISEIALIQEWFDGIPLDKQQIQSVAQVLPIMAQVARAMDAMHLAGYVHCDMKPGNILTNADGKVKVIDFGQACKIGTVKERVQGTPDFIAPEQVEKRPVTVKTDIFNFGASLYWALCKHKIPTFITVKKSKRELLRDSDMTPPIQINPSVPKDLSDIVMDCIKLDPVARPRSMGDVAKRLEAVKI